VTLNINVNKRDALQTAAIIIHKALDPGTTFDRCEAFSKIRLMYLRVYNNRVYSNTHPLLHRKEFIKRSYRSIMMDFSNNLMVCKQVQETVHHIFNSWFWSAPVIRNRQKGTLQRGEEERNVKREQQPESGVRVHRCVLTRGPVFCGCHRREGRTGAVLREAAIREDTWTTEEGKEKFFKMMPKWGRLKVSKWHNTLWI